MKSNLENWDKHRKPHKHRSSIGPAFACILIYGAFILFLVSVSFSYDLLRQMEDRDVL